MKTNNPSRHRLIK